MAVFVFMFSSLNANSIDGSQITLDIFDESSDCYDR